MLFFGIFNSVIWTMIFFQMTTLTFFPCFFIDVLMPQLEIYSNFDMKFGAFFLNLCQNPKGQFLKSLILTILIFSSVGFFYIILFQLDPTLFLSINIPVSPNIFSYIAVTFLLGFTNPWLEEWFWRVFFIRFFPETEFWRIIATFHYAIYHFFVLIILLDDWILAFLGFMGIFILGRFFLFLKMRYGFMVSGITHMASDISCLIIMFIIISYQMTDF